MNQKMIHFRFILRFFWPHDSGIDSRKKAKNSQGIGIAILLESESTQPYSGGLGDHMAERESAGSFKLLRNSEEGTSERTHCRKFAGGVNDKFPLLVVLEQIGGLVRGREGGNK